MRTTAIAAALLLSAGSASAAPYVDYTIGKGAWHVITVSVDPSRLDDYLTSLKKTWGASEAIAKRHGLIDSYQIMAKLNPEDGKGNVMLVEHIPNMALLDPDKARDLELMKELIATMSQADRSQTLANFDKYRTFVGDDYWKELTFTP